MCHQKETRTNQKLTSSIATYNVVFVVNIAAAGEVGTQRNCDEGGLQDPLASHAASHFKTSNYKNSAYDGGQKWTILFYLRLSRRIGRLLFRNGTVAREGSAGGWPMIVSGPLGPRSRAEVCESSSNASFLGPPSTFAAPLRCSRLIRLVAGGCASEVALPELRTDRHLTTELEVE